MVLRHVAHGEIAPRVGAGHVTVGVGVLEERAQLVRVPAGLLDRLVVGDPPVPVGDVLGEALDPPHVRHGGLPREVALHVVAGVEEVRVLVVEVPDPGREAVVGVLLVHDRRRLVGRVGRVAVERDAAVVGADAVDRAGVGLVVGAAGEDDELDGGDVLAGYGAVGLDQVPEVGVLVQHAGAYGGEVVGRQGLGADGVGRVAVVGDRQGGGGELGGQVADVVVRAIAAVVGVRLCGHRDPQGGRRAGDLRLVQQILGQRPYGFLEFGMLDVAGQVHPRVGVQEGQRGAEQVGVVQREVVQGVGDRRVRGDGVHIVRVPVAAPQRGVDVVDRPDHAVHGVVRAVVAAQQPLIDREIPALLVGAVGEDDGLAEDVAVGGRDVVRVHAGEEGVQAGGDGGGEAGGVRAHVRGVVELHVVPGPQEQDQLLQAAGVVAAVPPGLAGERGRHGEHLGLAEDGVRVLAGDREEGVHAVRGRGLHEGDEGGAGTTAEVGRGAGGRRGRPSGVRPGQQRLPGREPVRAEPAGLARRALGDGCGGAGGRRWGGGVRAGRGGRAGVRLGRGRRRCGQQAGHGDTDGGGSGQACGRTPGPAYGQREATGHGGSSTKGCASVGC